jgi:hypothetical protein
MINKPNPIPPMPIDMSFYENLRDHCETGDIILCSGDGPVSNVIKFGDRVKGEKIWKWSHVGMVVKSHDLNVVLMYQSTTLSKVKDYIDHKPKNGVQVNQLSDVIASYKGDIAIRRWQDWARTKDDLIGLNSVRNEYRNRPYEKSKLELLRALYDGPCGENMPDASSLFCSELVSYALEGMGMELEQSPNEYTPNDYARLLGMCHKDHGFVNLGPIEYLKRG